MGEEEEGSSRLALIVASRTGPLMTAHPIAGSILLAQRFCLISSVSRVDPLLLHDAST